VVLFYELLRDEQVAFAHGLRAVKELSLEQHRSAAEAKRRRLERSSSVPGQAALEDEDEEEQDEEQADEDDDEEEAEDTPFGRRKTKNSTRPAIGEYATSGAAEYSRLAKQQQQQEKPLELLPPATEAELLELAQVARFGGNTVLKRSSVKNVPAADASTTWLCEEMAQVGLHAAALGSMLPDGWFGRLLLAPLSQADCMLPAMPGNMMASVIAALDQGNSGYRLRWYLYIFSCPNGHVYSLLFMP